MAPYIYLSNSTKKKKKKTADKYKNNLTGLICHALAGPTQKSDCSHLSFFISPFIICSVVLKTCTRPPALTRRAPDGTRSHLSPRRRDGHRCALFSEQRLSNVFQTGWQQPLCGGSISLLDNVLAASVQFLKHK